jgi:S-adenosylmethionine synthetase
MNIIIGCQQTPDVDALDTEIVERKGLGHPDSICDALAEQLSLSLCRFYLDRFGLVLHHNVDKALLWAGSTSPAFGGGKVLRPFEFFIAGRATDTFKGVTVPVKDIAVDGARNWLRQHMHAVDPETHMVFHTLVRPGSSDLAELFLRQRETGVKLANDTSVGVGYAPLSELETIVYQVEQHLNAAETKAAHPEIGEDVKIMGIRRGNTIHLTVSCAFIDRHVSDIRDYADKRSHVGEIAREIAQRFARRDVTVTVNAADDLSAQSVFLTVTGTSAESGDDGEAGRGNRTNGLITPYRPMTMESVAGKNPITHVGKLYNLAAGLAAAALVEGIPEVVSAQCHLVSEIGRPIGDPQVADVKLRLVDPAALASVSRQAEAIVGAQLSRIDALWSDMVAGSLGFDRWPLDAGRRARPKAEGR